MTKRLVVCCDGTWNTADQAGPSGQPCPTNVAKLALSIAATGADGREQRVYYHPGVGTGRWDHIRGGAFGYGLSANVLDAYQFLVDNYEPDDELFFFGFSRGAFTARSAAGFVRNCGILRRRERERIPAAYALYRDRLEHPRGYASTLFRQSYSYTPGIRFIGVWDTVGELGIPVPTSGPLRPFAKLFNRRWAFHDTALSTTVDGAFQALAIDEKRAVFAPTIWTKQQSAREQVLEQVWFAGVHCDVGGGYPQAGLSDIALAWMFEKARNFGLAINEPPIVAATSAVVDPAQDALVTMSPRDPLSQLHETRTKFYTLWRPYYRPMGEHPAGAESLGTAAMERRDADPTYRPPNLEDYLATKPVQTTPT
jgi:uncharacterized protein (DUF2235 family)